MSRVDHVSVVIISEYDLYDTRLSKVLGAGLIALKRIVGIPIGREWNGIILVFGLLLALIVTELWS